MLTTLRKKLPTVVRLVIAISYVTGIWFIYSGFYQLKLYGDARTMMSNSATIGKHVAKVVLGIVLLMMPQIINIMIWSLWGNDYSMDLYPDFSGSSLNEWAPTLKSAIAIIRVFGYISFLRGFMMLSKASSQQSQPGSISKGAMHVIGGLLCINIIGTINVVKSSFGF